MIIKCVKFECEVCGKLSSVQVFYNKSGTVKYARARHYKGRANGKPQFEYHQQSIEYIQSKLSSLSIVNTEIGHSGHTSNIDLEIEGLSSKISSLAGGKGFEPLTLSLEG